VRRLLRYLLLVLGVAAAHLALLWLWDPRVPVPPPSVHEVRSGTRDFTPADPREVVVVVGGDTAPTDAATPMIQRFGYEYPFAATVHLLRESDLAVVNLEAAVTTREQPFPLYKRYLYKVHPAALEAITWAGVGAVTLANNHVMDYGRAGFLDTLSNLRRAGIVPIGAGESGAEARRGAVFEIRGTRVGVLSYLEDTLMHSVYVRSFAAGPTGGCARLGLAAVRSDLERMRRHADVVVAIVHWGRNYGGITLAQRIYGRQLLDFGADVVIGHHPHIHQPVALHRGKPILYSLGNYAFGTPGREWFRHGMLARLRLRDKRLARIELIPLLVQNRLVHFKPERLEGDDARVMLQELARRSAPLGARIGVVGKIGVLELRDPT
jgi:poly-gamma-glutamate capsule biosynthesis protein CapA/YwtB (metallophosphatase superfamily)